MTGDGPPEASVAEPARSEVREDEAAPLGRRRLDLVRRILLAVVPLAAVVVGLRASGLLDSLNAEGIRAAVAELGWLGPVGYLMIYVVGILAHLPGAIFVASAVLAYGPFVGFVLAYLGGTAANLVCFAVIRGGRRLGGGASSASSAGELTGSAGRFLARLRGTRLGAALERRPVVGVILVRLLFPTAAPASFGLSLLPISLTVYLSGSLLGLIPQLAATVLIFAVGFSGL